MNLGLLWAGGIASPANPTYTPEELARQLKDSGAKALITQVPFLQTAFRAAEIAGLPKERILVLGDARDGEGRVRHWAEVTAKEAWIAPGKPNIDPRKDIAYLAYSSVSKSQTMDRSSIDWFHRAQRACPRASC